jgi:hypothetical protein
MSQEEWHAAWVRVGMLLNGCTRYDVNAVEELIHDHSFPVQS